MNLPDAPPQGPVGFGPQLWEHEQYLEELRNYASEKVDPELLDDRQDLWRLDLDPPKPYWYLRGETHEAHLHFHGWVKVIKEDLQCDDRACGYFIKLFKTYPPGAPHGFMEACRVLAHILKDKMKPEDTWRPEREDWSRFLQKACEEAVEALENHEHVKDLKLRSSGSWSSWGTHQVPVPGAPASSGDDHKGKGKGKYMQQGQR